MAYFEHAHEVAHQVMRGFATGLGLEPMHFLRTASATLSRASFVWYPPQPEDAGPPRLGVGARTDFGVLTVLCQDDLGGLQVQDARGPWIEAPPVAGTLVVNVADLLSRWTGGALKSTPHRVVNTSGRERLSLVLAFDPDPDTVIDPASVPAAGPDRAPPITCGDYLTRRFARAFACRAG